MELSQVHVGTAGSDQLPLEQPQVDLSHLHDSGQGLAHGKFVHIEERDQCEELEHLVVGDQVLDLTDGFSDEIQRGLVENFPVDARVVELLPLDGVQVRERSLPIRLSRVQNAEGEPHLVSARPTEGHPGHAERHRNADVLVEEKDLSIDAK